MTPEQFCYWLNGFGELSPDVPTPEQWQSIKEHLATVFNKVTPRVQGQLKELNRRAIDKQMAWAGRPNELRVTC